MTDQVAPPPPPFDPGNPFIGPYPATLTTDIVDTPNGQQLLLTIRAAGATLTVLLVRDDAMAWGHHVKQQAGRISPLVVAGGALVVPNGAGT